MQVCALQMKLTAAQIVYSSRSRSAQPCDVLGDRLDFPVGHARGDTPHHAVRIVRAPADTERLQLGLDILGKLPGNARGLRGDARAGRAMAAGAGRNSGGRVAATIDFLPL